MQEFLRQHLPPSDTPKLQLEIACNRLTYYKKCVTAYVKFAACLLRHDSAELLTSRSRGALVAVPFVSEAYRGVQNYYGIIRFFVSCTFTPQTPIIAAYVDYWARRSDSEPELVQRVPDKLALSSRVVLVSQLCGPVMVLPMHANWLIVDAASKQLLA